MNVTLSGHQPWVWVQWDKGVAMPAEEKAMALLSCPHITLALLPFGQKITAEGLGLRTGFCLPP